MFYTQNAKYKHINFSQHSIERAAEYGLDQDTARDMLIHSEITFPNYRRAAYKNAKYGASQDGVKYYQYEDYLFTVREYPKSFVVITITDLRKNSQKEQYEQVRSKKLKGRAKARIKYSKWNRTEEQELILRGIF